MLVSKIDHVHIASLPVVLLLQGYIYHNSNTELAGVILMEGGTEHDLQSLVNPVPEKEDSKDVEEEKVEEKVGEIVETEEGNEKEPQENNVQESPKRGDWRTGAS